MGKLWKFAMGSPGQRKGEVLSGYLLLQSKNGASASSMRGTIAAVQIAKNMEWIPTTVAPIHGKLAKRGGGGGASNFTPSLRFSGKRRDGARVHRGGGPWWYSCAFLGSLCSGLVQRPLFGWRMFVKRPSGFGPLRLPMGLQKELGRVVPAGAPVFETAVTGFHQGTEFADGGSHGHQRGGGMG